jgi:hypothetical protein
MTTLLGVSPIPLWTQIRERNEVLDCWVGCLAMRKALPRYIEAGLEYSIVRPEQPVPETSQAPAIARQADSQAVVHEAYAASLRQPRFVQVPETGWIGARKDWMNRG